MDQLVQDTPPDLREMLLAYWRRRRIFWIIAGAAALITVLIALLWPPTYRATATILIEQQEIPQEMVRSVITSFADQRVQVISQRVMTTQNLMSLIERYNLYPDIRDKQPREVLLKKMREDIAMKMISADVIDPKSGRPTQATIAFTVSYENRSPDLALKVANDLTSLYLNENLTNRTKLSQQTAEFFTEEAGRQQAHIDELDKQLAVFKAKHRDELPDLNQLNIQTMERTDFDLRDAENHIASIDAQVVLLKAQLAQIHPNTMVYSDSGERVFGAEDRLKQLKTQLAAYKAKYAPGHPDIISTERQIQGLEEEVKAQDATSDRLRQLEQAKAQLADDLKKYSPEHPDVVRLQHLVESLEKQVTEDDAAGIHKLASNHADNPAYIQVKGQIDSLIVDREAAVKKRDDLIAKRDDYERRRALAPDVERQYREMARDLDAAQLKYQEILSKQTESQVSENLETERKGEKFTLIEPPQPPEKPVSPNRPVILLVGLLLTLGLAIAGVVAREALDVAVRGPSDIRQLLKVPALASIPIIVTAAERERSRRITRYSWGGTIAALILAVAAVHFFFRPLDVLWQLLLRRIGV